MAQHSAEISGGLSGAGGIADFVGSVYLSAQTASSSARLGNNISEGRSLWHDLQTLQPAAVCDISGCWTGGLHSD